MKDVQATGEASSLQKRTLSTRVVDPDPDPYSIGSVDPDPDP